VINVAMWVPALAGRALHVQVGSHWWRGHSYYDLW
jgi:UDP-N-acetyl-2-amino-2-deoxyglucuronate dehydrogenase